LFKSQQSTTCTGTKTIFEKTNPNRATGANPKRATPLRSAGGTRGK